MMNQPRFRYRVLVVEDNRAEREMLCVVLGEDGFECVGCSTGAEALAEVEAGRFAAAVVDLGLPDIHGTQLLERIRALDEQVRVIIHTGAASYDSAKDAVNLGGFAYVEKLGKPGELLQHVHRACREWMDRYALRLEAAVAARTDELARSNRELADFASVVAHDLRSPLLTISGFCHLLQEEFGPKLEGDADEYLRQIIEAVVRMSRLIDDLLDYSRVGRSPQPFTQVNLEAVAAQAVANLQADIQAAGATVEVGELPCVVGDPTRLAQLFQNLIGNAVKFHSDRPPVVRLRASRQDDRWRIDVADNGIGIAPEHFEKVFQVFQRLHHSREYTGTGIGLAVCKKIVEHHGGRIWLESEVGRGTSVLIDFPVSFQSATSKSSTA
jgi:signal transduction histidine kinase